MEYLLRRVGRSKNSRFFWQKKHLYLTQLNPHGTRLLNLNSYMVYCFQMSKVRACAKYLFKQISDLVFGGVGWYFDDRRNILTDGIFKSGACGEPSKWQNPTLSGQGGPSSTQCSNPSWACHWHNPFHTNSYHLFRQNTKNQVLNPT